MDNSKLIEKAKAIKLLLLDADGVLTDGRIIYDDQGRELKCFNVRDGHGIRLLIRTGIEVGIISGRASKALEYRAKELDISILYQKIFDKIKVYDEIVKEKGLEDSRICYVGDDLVDLPLMRKVGLSVSVADGCEHIKEGVDYITTKKGGNGAVREVCELILNAQGKWEAITDKYFRDNDE